MSKIKLVISDLHLADGHPIFEGFGDLQQSAFEGLLSAASNNVFAGNLEDTELIINGDCFEFLFMEPHDRQGISHPATAMSKLEKVIAVHRPFFNTLQRFISQPGKHVTFIIGNHDVELAFEELQTCIRATICTHAGLKERVNFCHSSFYRPLPDIHIEHGNNYDFWNRITGLWDEQGQPLIHNPGTIILPPGTQYIQRAAYPINVLYPYFDHFEPTMNLTPQIALLCLLNPEIVVATGRRTMEMLSYPLKPLAGFSPHEERISARLFEQAMLDLAAYQEDMVVHTPKFTEPPGDSAQVDTMLEFAKMCEAMSLPPAEAIKNIFSPSIYRMAESTARGMHNILQADSSVRYAIAGHTHMHRRDSLNGGSQIYLNTGTWTTRFAIPNPEEITPELIAWLGKPDWNAIPLHDKTQFVFALVRAKDGEPSEATLCTWEGGVNGTYHVLN